MEKRKGEESDEFVVLEDGEVQAAKRIAAVALEVKGPKGYLYKMNRIDHDVIV